jgi:outer membrane lipoprotein-sorting protein
MRLIGDPTPNVAGVMPPSDAKQTLWVDSKSLLPLRWQLSEYGVHSYTLEFNYASIDLRRPAHVEVPDCIR